MKKASAMFVLALTIGGAFAALTKAQESPFLVNGARIDPQTVNVLGNSTFGDSITDIATSSGPFGINATASSTNNLIVKAIGTGTDHVLHLQGNDAKSIVRVEARGRVGVGMNASPGYIFEVSSGTASDYVASISNTNTSDSYGLRLQGGAAGSNTNEPLTVNNAAGTKRFAVTGAGNVIVGSIAPASVLHVDGSAQFGTAAVGISSFTTSGFFKPVVLTVTQFNTAVPDAVGNIALCSNCTINYSVCVATGTSAAQWKVSHSATVGCGTNN